MNSDLNDAVLSVEQPTERDRRVYCPVRSGFRSYQGPPDDKLRDEQIARFYAEAALQLARKKAGAA